MRSGCVPADWSMSTLGWFGARAGLNERRGLSINRVDIGGADRAPELVNVALRLSLRRSLLSFEETAGSRRS